MMPAAATVVDGQHPDSANVATIADRADDGQDAAARSERIAPARVVDHQVGVVGVAGVGRGALVGQLGMQCLPKGPCEVGQPDLGAEVRQQLGAPLIS